jgi:hydroxymethylglutaryl-CoA lyase
VRCPVDGDVHPGQVADVTTRLLNIGVEEIDLGDTIGAATPESLGSVLDAVLAVCKAQPPAHDGSTWAKLDAPPVTIHLHDTFGQASACVMESLRRGIRSFDSSVAGLGGCPYAGSTQGRAPGNVSTETLVDAISSAGFECGIDRKELSKAAEFARALVSGELPA